MWEQLLITAIISIGTAVATYALAPTPPRPKPPSLDDIEFPTAKQGSPIPVVFGTVTVKGPNVVWYGDLHYEPIKAYYV